MGVRGFVRDLLSIYVVYKVLSMRVPKDLLIASLLLGAFTVWFLLEKIGILPKL